ncbi:Gephyrin [Dactylella cylindrospora]|nr:Gephyrin [Dactylella cylindrospora]
MEAPIELTIGLLVVSDTAAADHATDRAIDTLTSVIAETNAENNNANFEWLIEERRIVPDDKEAIQEKVKDWCDNKRLSLVLSTGGTGFGVRDVTPEAVSELFDKTASGLVHGMLAASLKITPFAIMSRPVAGIRKDTVIITLPGSPKGAKENLESIIKLLPHACIQAAGGDSRTLHAGGVKKLEKEAGVSASVGNHDHHSHLHEEDGLASAGGDLNHHHHHHGHHAPRPRTQQTAELRSNELGDSVTGRHRSSPYPMISVEEAHRLIAENIPTPRVAQLKVDSSLVGHILAEDVKAAESVPAFRASIVDGYAIHHTDGVGIYPVVSVSHAAPGEILPLGRGQITRITTGAPLPPGATAVVMVEDTKIAKTTADGKEEVEVEILASGLEPMENVREVGSDVKAGDVILRKGAEITAVGGEVGLLASVGIGYVTVYQKPVIGVFSTGDEVVNHDRPGDLKLGEIRDSNRPTLIAAIKARGFEPVDLGIAKDRPGSLEDTIKDALSKVDVIITTGGVSMGEKDLLKPTIERTFNGTIHFGRVAMKPGKPTTFATIPFETKDETVDKPIFSLPGNPASATVTFHLFVLPALRQLSGHVDSDIHLPKALVTLEHDVALDPRPEYHRAAVRIDQTGGLVARSTGGQRSSRIGSMGAANALLCLPSLNQVGDKRARIPKGDKIEALLIGELKVLEG